MSDYLISNKVDISAVKISSNTSDNKALNENKLYKGNSQPKIDFSPKTIADSAEGVSLDKLLQGIGLEKIDPQVVSTLKSYGITINSENIKLIAELFKNMPNKLSVGDFIGLVISRKVNIENGELVDKYTKGTLNFSDLFGKMSKEALLELKKSWGANRVLERLESLLKVAKGLGEAKETSELAKKFAENLELQEVFSFLPEKNKDGSIYFQWPMFWEGQDIPDTLEGEVFVPNSEDKEKSFSLRLLINPPNLGKTEVFLSARKKELYVNFGVDNRLKDPFRSIFMQIRKNILALEGYTSVYLTLGELKTGNNFFSRKDKIENRVRSSLIDFKA